MKLALAALVYLVIALVLGAGIFLMIAATVAAHHRFLPYVVAFGQDWLPVAKLI